jgi:hypothetical protein
MSAWSARRDVAKALGWILSLISRWVKTMEQRFWMTVGKLQGLTTEIHEMETVVKGGARRAGKVES